LAERTLATYTDQLRAFARVGDFSQVAITFDQWSDTLMLHLYGFGVPGVSVPVKDGLMFRLRLGSDEVIGVQIEGVLAHTAREMPFLFDLIDIAEVDDFEPDPVWSVRREVAAIDPAPRIRDFIDNTTRLVIA
jgi:hypothetical protein